MKILYIGNMDDVHTPKWAQWFIAHGHDVHKSHFKDLWHFVKHWRSFRSWVHDRFKPDIVHAHYAGTWGLIGALICGKLPYVVTVHGSEILLTRGIKRRLVRWVLKQATLVTTDGKHVEKEIQQMGIDKTKIRMIRFGVDVNKFTLGTVRCTPPMIAYRVGQGDLYDEKTIREAIIKLSAQGFSLVYCPLRGLSEANMVKALQRSTVYVSAARSDAGLASTTAEAMACGIPVVISEVGENSLWARSDRQIFQPGDYKELAKKISWFLENPKQAEKIGLENRITIITFNNYDCWMKRMEGLYEGLVGKI